MTNQEKGIQWTDFTSNPIKYRDEAGKSVWACVKVSDGCKNCYAETLAKRYGRGGPFSLPQTKKVTAYFDAKEAKSLLKSTKITGKRVFIGDMTDIFGDWVLDEILDKLFAVFALRPDVTFQILTKRPERLAKYTTTPFVSNRILEAMHVVDPERGVWSWPGWDDAMRNVWFGTSVENQKAANERIPWLLKCPATVRFLSAEPLLEPISLNTPLKIFTHKGPPCCIDREGYHQLGDGLKPKFREARNLQIHWVIVGGESGPRARPCDLEWIRSIIEQCKQADVACFVKQLGADAYTDTTCTCGHNSDGSWKGPAACFACAGRLPLKDSHGGDMSEWPEDIRIRQFPVKGQP